jgi:TonB family protein
MEEASMSRIRLLTSVVTVVAVVAAGGWWSVQAFPLRDTVALPAPPTMVAFAAAPAPPYSSLQAAPAHAVEPSADLAPQSQTPPPQAPRPGMSTAPSAIPLDQASLEKMIQEKPAYLPAYYVLAQIYEKAGDQGKAAATLEAAVNAAPQERGSYLAIIGFYNRQGNFDKVAEWLGRWTTMEPQNPEVHYTASTYYWEKVYRDQALTEAQKRAYLDHGLQEADTAIAMNPDYVEALTYKNILLRSQALLETDPTVRTALLAEADTLRARAIAIREARAVAGQPTATYPPPKPPSGGYVAYAAAPPPPPPPPPSAGVKTGLAGGVSGGVLGGVPGGVEGGVIETPTRAPAVSADGKVAPVRVGGNIPPPTKVRDVKPVYPEEARQARVQGVVIVEATIDEAGKVSNVRILRSIPLFDQAALDAVKQWEFTPTLVNGVPVPVIMTATVNFTLEK